MTQKKSLFKGNNRSKFNFYDDWVFHYVFSKNTEDSNKALVAMLNLILDQEEDPIVSVEILNPVHYGETREDKGTILDIKASTSRGELIDVEMENGDLTFHANRAVYYGGKLLVSSLEKGDGYDKMKKSIIISFVTGKMFPKLPQFFTTFHLREDIHSILLTDCLELHFIELGKIQKGKPPEEMTPLEQYAAYLKYAGEEKEEDYVKQLISTGGEAIHMAEKLFGALSEDRIAIELQISRELYEHNQATKRAIEEMRRAQEEKEAAERLEKIEKAAARLEKAEKEAAERMEKAEKEAAERVEKAEKEGQQQGEALFAKLTEILLRENRLEDLQKCTTDLAYRKQLYKEFNL